MLHILVTVNIAAYDSLSTEPHYVCGVMSKWSECWKIPGSSEFYSQTLLPCNLREKGNECWKSQGWSSEFYSQTLLPTELLGPSWWQWSVGYGYPTTSNLATLLFSLGAWWWDWTVLWCYVQLVFRAWHGWNPPSSLCQSWPHWWQ